MYIKIQLYVIQMMYAAYASDQVIGNKLAFAFCSVVAFNWSGIATWPVTGETDNHPNMGYYL